MSADRVHPAGGDSVRLAINGDKVAGLHVVVSDSLDRIGALFKPEMNMKLTFIARSPEHPDGTRDVVVTNDTIDGAIAALQLRAGR